MKWYERLWKTKARRYLLVAALMATGVGAPAALTIGTAIDSGIEEIETESRD